MPKNILRQTDWEPVMPIITYKQVSYFVNNYSSWLLHNCSLHTFLSFPLIFFVNLTFTSDFNNISVMARKPSVFLVKLTKTSVILRLLKTFLCKSIWLRTLTICRLVIYLQKNLEFCLVGLGKVYQKVNYYI